jgi:uncharacterized membrane protein YsdA (DUF1294 family)
VIDLSFLTLRNILLWIGGWSLLGFLIMGEDKDLAKSQKDSLLPERISERTLHELALIGGFAGIVLGSKVFHHKTAKPAFWPPVGAAIVLWIVLLVWLLQDGLLQVTI